MFIHFILIPTFFPNVAGPIREIQPGRLLTLQSSEVRRICLEDFRNALAKVRISVSAQDVAKYEEWNTRFGDVS